MGVPRTMRSWIVMFGLGACFLMLAVAAVLTVRPELFLQRFAAAQSQIQPDAQKAAADAAKQQPARQGKGQADAAVAVEASTARQAKTTSDIRAIGSLQSDEAVHVASEIAGRVAEISFKEGQPIAEGATLIKLDDALAQADLADAQARRTLAAANNDRARTLSRTGNVTGRARDEAVSNYETSDAAVALAQVRLAKHTLKAPFAGVAGVRTVSVGAYVAIGTPLVNIEKIDSLKVDFKVPETYLNDVKPGQKIEVLVDAIPGRTFEGEIYAINPLVDVNGRALQIRARLANPEMVLRPGLFARILVKGLAEREVVLIPESAIVPRGSEAFVFRIDNGKAIEARVKLGERKDAEVEVLEGLDPRATVVTAGQQKLRNGSTVDIVVAEPKKCGAVGPQPNTGTGAGRSG